MAKVYRFIFYRRSGVEAFYNDSHSWSYNNKEGGNILFPPSYKDYRLTLSVSILSLAV